MKKEYLVELGIAEDVAAKIMDENGKDIQNIERKLTAMTGERDTVQTQLTEVQEKLKGFEVFEGVDVAELQTKIATLNTELSTAQANHTTEIAKIKRQSETKEFMASLKFVNDETREFYFNKLESALDDEANTGKGRKEILDALTVGEDGKTRANVFAAEEQTPPPYAAGTGSNPMLPEEKDEFSKRADKYRR